MKNLFKLIKREIQISLADMSSLCSFVTLFFLGVLIFVLGFGSDISELKKLFLPIVWVVFLFSLILGAENFITNDFNDGSLKELQFLGFSHELIFISKSISMWIILIFPCLIMIPIFSIMFSIQIDQLINFTLNLLIASPTLVLISLISSLLSLQVRKNRILQFIIVLPFYVPPLILSTSITEKSNNFFILIAIFFITLPIALILSKLIFKEINR